MIYRTDIDGLRAVAVCLVVVFHINEALIPGGFIGVDMFFVISGYLITGIMLRDIEAGRFSFAEFYRRRAKRIFPAVFVVTLTSLLAGAWILLPDDMVALSKSALATMLFVANIFFTVELDTGYFAADSRTIPLLHMWSLGVEEQFYLVWPALMLGLIRAPRLCMPLLALLLGASVALGEFAINEGWSSFAYYMLPTRAFQLLAGATLIFAERSDRVALSPDAAFALGAAGLAAVIGSAAFLHGEAAYPGLRAVPVTLGTMFLLVSGRRAQPLASVLSSTPMRWIGLISFSLYLWHWPVLAFQRYLMPELGWKQQVASLLFMLVLSQLTYQFVERPFRERPITFGRALRQYWVYPGLCVGLIGAAHIGTDGFGIHVFTDLRQRMESQTLPAFRSPYVCQAAELTPEKISDPLCVLGHAGPARTLLLGDSNAAHFVTAFDEVAQRIGFRFRNVAHSACPPVIGNTRPFTLARYDESCTKSRELIITRIADYDTVILAAAWDAYAETGGDAFLEALEATLDTFLADNKTILIVGVVPRHPNFDRLCMAKRLKQSWMSCDEASAKPERPDINRTLERIAAQKPGVWYLEPYAALCNETECPTLSNGNSLYFDGSHLSHFGSGFLGKRWMEGDASHAILREVFRQP